MFDFNSHSIKLNQFVYCDDFILGPPTSPSSL